MDNNDEFDYKGFMQDFYIADVFGNDAIKDTYNRAFEDWKDNVEYFASLVLTLNHLIWFWHSKGNDERAKLYEELWLKADEYGSSHFVGDEASYYFHFLD